MGVDHAPRELTEERLAEDAHEARGDDPVRREPAHRVRQRTVPGRAVGVIGRTDDRGGQSGGPGAGHGLALAIGDQADHPVGAVGPVGRVQDALRERAGTGGQEYDLAGCSGLGTDHVLRSCPSIHLPAGFPGTGRSLVGGLRALVRALPGRLGFD